MSRVRLDRPWLTFDLGAKMQVLSWAINRPGFVSARQIIWREVRNADLPENLDVANWFDNELKAHGLEQSVAFLTSRDVSWFIDRTVTIGSVTAQSVVTVGLSNAERVGQRIDRDSDAWQMPQGGIDEGEDPKDWQADMYAEDAAELIQLLDL